MRNTSNAEASVKRQPTRAAVGRIIPNPTLEGRQPVDLRGGTCVSTQFAMSFAKRTNTRVSGNLVAEAFAKATAEGRHSFTTATWRPPGGWDREGVTREEQRCGVAEELRAAAVRVGVPGAGVRASALKSGSVGGRRKRVRFASMLEECRPIPSRGSLPAGLWW